MFRLALILGLALATSCTQGSVEPRDAGSDSLVDAGVDAKRFGLYVGSCLERRLVDGLGTRTGPGLTCRSNNDCKALANGACLGIEGDGGTIVQSFCRYEGCASNADCDSGEVCECSFGELRQCLRVECRADSDCADGHRCLRTRIGCTDLELGHFLCTTDEDQCLTHADCEARGAQWCVPGDDHRVCTIHTCE